MPQGTQGAAARANRPESDAHWYTLAAQPMHEAGLRDARKLNLLPSITTVLKELSATGLEIWKQNQLLTAQHENPRHESEPLDDYFRRVVAISREVVTEAADRGTAIHDAAERALKGEAVDAGGDELVAVVVEWVKANIPNVIATERVVVSLGMGLAGRMDCLAELKDLGPVVIDFKTRKFKEYKRTGWRAGWYDKDILQLAFYASCVPGGARVANVGINTHPDAPIGAEHSIDFNLWPENEQAEALEIVRSVVRVWQWRHKYRPEVTVENIIAAEGETA